MPTEPSNPPPAPSETSAPTQRRFPCKKCGARVEFLPGQDSLLCPYCGTQNEIVNTGHAIKEQDLRGALRQLEEAAPHETVATVKCDACAAESAVPPNVTSYSCPFCGSNIVTRANECSVVRPHAVLPFGLSKQQALTAYRAWIASRWFAPSVLKQRAMLDDGLRGIYLPHWTYDATAHTAYTGQRGDAYMVTTTVMVNGRPMPRQERRVRWSAASGTVHNTFDDILVPASPTLDQQRVRELTPWDLAACVPYQDDYLAGFTAERYQVPLEEGFREAERLMEGAIHTSIRRDIGGDEQRVSSSKTTYSELTFKLVLLPIWVSAYRYQGKVYQFMVNAQTGEVQGTRPYSPWKIAFAVLAALVVVALITLFVARG